MVQDLGQQVVAEWVDNSAQPFSAVAGGVAYFLRSDGIQGRELWRSDGTPAGTHLLRDICPGVCGIEHLSSWANLATLGSRVYFAADDGAHGNELWVTDGTSAGTRMVIDLRPGPDSSNPGPLFALDGLLWYAADDGVHGREPWRSDGTAPGTSLLFDLVPGAAGSGVSGIEPGPGFVYLRNTSSLWRSDGSAAGTALLCETCVGAPNTSVIEAAAFRSLPNGLLVFAGGACWAAAECEPWVSDGTVAGTHQLVDLFLDGASNPQGFHAVGAEIWFAAYAPPPPTLYSRRALFRTDGTPAGTLPLPLPDDVDASTYFGNGAAVGGRLFFAGWDENAGAEPWVTDGLATARLADLKPGPESSLGFSFGFDVPAFAALGSQLLFLADDGTGTKLWRTGGEIGDLSLVTDFGPPPAGSYFAPYQSVVPRTVVNGRLLLWLTRPDRGVELWSSDATAGGTFVARTIADQTSSFVGGLSRTYYARVRDTCFAASDRGVTFLALEDPNAESDPRGLYFSDGVQIETLVKSFSSNYEAGFAGCGTLGGQIFALGGPESEGFGLWSSDGTTVGTRLELLLQSSTPGFDPAFARLGNDLLFLGIGDLYAIRGNSQGPASTANGGELRIDPLGFVPHVGWGELRPAGELLMIAGAGGLVAADGQSPPYVLLGEPPLPGGEETGNQAWTGSSLFFTRWTEDEGNELWRTDGTPAGTSLVQSLRPGPESGVPMREHWESWDRDGHARVAALPGDRVVFAGDDGVVGAELWTSDGTAAGTTRIADLFPGSAPSTPRQLVSLGAVVLFVAEDPVHGLELFRTDGTGAGTALVRDLVPGPASSLPQEFAVIESVLYFSAWTPAHGREAWRSDGTALGTYRLTDAAPGRRSSSPSRFAKAGNRLFFVANDNVHGFELWALESTSTSPISPPGPPRRVVPASNRWRRLDLKSMRRGTRVPISGPSDARRTRPLPPSRSRCPHPRRASVEEVEALDSPIWRP
jgi:ELWxxDGT repeat protein